jgi:hypothetical protein
MSAIPILLADAITAVINTAEAADAFSQAFTAVRSYPIWADDFEGLKDLSVDVVFVSSGGQGALAELDSAQTLETEPAIDIAVRKRFQTPDRDDTTNEVKASSVDALVKLVEEIYETVAADRMTAIELASGVYANWVDSTIRTYCDYDRLRQGVFVGIVRIRFVVSKASV